MEATVRGVGVVGAERLPASRKDVWVWGNTCIAGQHERVAAARRASWLCCTCQC